MKGPTIISIPAREELRCSGCEYFKHTLVRSGFNPLYNNNCNHPEIKQSKWPWEGNLPDDGITPEWCPYLINKAEL